ncbi:MAG: sulfite exporter TauE/SafE family protein [Gammaproteobacteria bacterium]|nr:sulfite exporter TauE/SafE family protein [Gammaproteobacteria bacterium]
MNLTVIVVAFLGSAFAGLTLGLLGGGIGLVLVPLIIWLLNVANVPPHLIMHLAVGTTVAITFVVGMLASYQHHSTSKVNWSIVKRMSWGLILGSAIGAMVAKYLPSNILMLTFAIVTFLLALQIWRSSNKKNTTLLVSSNLKKYSLIIGSFIIGFLGSVLGANPFCVPLLKKMNYEILEAIATTVVIGTIMAIVVVILFIILGWSEKGLPAYTTGYIVWPLFLPVLIVSCLFVPIGVKLAGLFSQTTLNRLYVGLLIGVALKMIYASGYLY